MVKINFIVLFFIFLSPIVCAQRVVVSDSVVFSGVVFDTQDSQTLPNVTCRYGEGKATISDQMGCFVLKIGRKDTVRFTFVGYKPCTARYFARRSVHDGGFSVSRYLTIIRSFDFTPVGRGAKTKSDQCP